MTDSAWQDLIDAAREVLIALVTIPVNSGEKFYVVYLASFLGLAYLSYRRYYRHRTRRNFLGFVFPRRIYLHPSAKVDYWVFLINVVTSPLFLVAAGLQAFVSTAVAAWLIGINDGQPLVTGDWGYVTFACFILGYTLVADLSVYVIHRFHHQVDLFWPIHALHHSAEVLTPVTLFRKHPVWNVLSSSLQALFTGLFQGVFLFVIFGNPGVEILFGLNSIYMLYNFFGANLRHSHIWLSWGDGRIGQAMSHLFISPAMHQIHHDPKRMHKNYGEVFAIWDWMFGSLYVPRTYEQFDIGLGEEKNPHRSVWAAYWQPVAAFGQNAWRLMSRGRHPRQTVSDD